jgi:hypothetical protein
MSVTDYILGFLMGVMITTLLFFASGCATISMTSPDGYRASYTRIGDQQLQGLVMRRDEMGWHVTLEKQSSDAKILEVIGALVGVAK